MSESQFIGRRPQLEDLQQHVYHILSGQPRILLIEGLAGVGKTSLLMEVESLSRQQSMEVYYGTCGETTTEPYAPFIGLLPRLEAAGVVEMDHMTLLQRLFGASAPAVSIPTLDQARKDHVTFLLGVSHALIQIADSQPLVLIVDNLHAADGSTLELFEYLAFALAEQRTAPVILVGSYRPVASDTPVGQLISRLQREAITRAFALPGFEEHETRELLQSLGVERPTQQLVQTIQQTTHGIPLFIQEAVHHARRIGALYTRGGYLAVREDAVATMQLPPDILSAIASRIDALPADCREVMTRAALLGDGFSQDRLTILEQPDRVGTQAALETAMQHGILRREDDRYVFTHALIRQVLMARLSPEQRQYLHLHIAQQLDQTRGAHLLEMTHHLLEAGRLVDALTLADYAEQAGDQAFSRFAWRDAARYYEAALGVETPLRGRARLHQQAGLSHYRNQDIGPALEHFEQARQLYGESQDTPGLAQALMWLVRARLTHASVPMGVLAPHVEELDVVLDSLGASELLLRGHIMTVLAQAFRHARQAERGERLARAALAIGRQVNDDGLCAQAAQSLGVTQLSSLQIDTAIATWQEALDSARAANDLMLQRLTLTNLPLALNLQGNLEEGETTALEGAEVTKRVQDWGLHTRALSHLTSITVARGNFSVADRYAHDTMVMLERCRYSWGGFRALHAIACASTARGLWNEADNVLNTLIQPGRVFTTPGRIVQVFTRVFRQLILGYQSVRLTEKIAPLHDELMEVVTYDTYSLAPLCAMIELGYFTFMPQFAERPAQMLSHAMAEGVFFTSGWNFLVPRSLGLAAMMQENWEEAAEHLQHAITIATNVNALPELGRSYLDYANLIHTNPDTEDYTTIEEPLQQARRIFYEQNMAPFAKHASELLNRLFIENDFKYDDEDEEGRDGDEPPEPPPFRNGTTEPG